MEYLIAIIVLALAFDFINGFHDSANSIATVVSTKVLKPVVAVIWAAFFNFVAFFIAEYLLGFNIANTVQKVVEADIWFKRAQLLSSACLSIGHGLNDSQKEIGVIACALTAYAAQYGLDSLPHWLLPDTEVLDSASHNLTGAPVWIPIACITAIAIGTMSGGWKIIKTMGNKITRITAVEGFCSQAAGAITLFVTQNLGIPVSTTHVISGSIMGVGAVKRLSAVRWGVSLDLITAWVITIPVSALIGALVYGIVIACV